MNFDAIIVEMLSIKTLEEQVKRLTDIQEQIEVQQNFDRTEKKIGTRIFIITLKV